MREPYLLAVDIGNTTTAAGCLRDGRVVYQARFATGGIRDAAAFREELARALARGGIAGEDIGGGIFSSVAPQASAAVREGLRLLTGREPLQAGPELHTGLSLLVDDPARVGTDRIVIAAAAVAERRPPLLLMDLGTATTIEVVEPENRYVGGVIIPGVRTALDALTAKAAQLPAIGLHPPERVIGRNTAACMQSGILYGTAALLDGLIDRIGEELGHPSTLVATGGLAPVIVPLCRHAIALEEDLLLRGLGVLYRLNS